MVTQCPEGLWAGCGQRLTAGQPGQVALAKGQGKAPVSWSQRCWDCPLLPQLGCTLPHSCLFLPCAWHERHHSGVPWAVCLCSRKATILVPYSIPTYRGHSCLCRLLGSLESRFSGVCPGVLTALQVWGGTGTLPAIRSPLLGRFWS